MRRPKRSNSQVLALIAAMVLGLIVLIDVMTAHVKNDLYIFSCPRHIIEGQGVVSWAACTAAMLLLLALMIVIVLCLMKFMGQQTVRDQNIK